MRIAGWLVALCCFAGSAMGQKSGSFQEPCSSHIQSTWPEELRGAAQTDCAFFEQAQRDGAAAWVKFAAEDAAMAGLNGREQIRSQFEKVYAKPGFRLLWYPSAGTVYGKFVVTTGNYERHALGADGKETVSHGRYITVWQKQADGSYLYVWDGGE
jgi:ketosteroid isomerase-like protein